MLLIPQDKTVVKKKKPVYLVIRNEATSIISRYTFSKNTYESLALESSKNIFFSSCNFRSCWVCFATDEDDRTAEWVRPCRCRGSTKWVHQTCLQRWVDEKQRGNSTARVACPQCNAEYLIVFPKLGKMCIILIIMGCFCILFLILCFF